MKAEKTNPKDSRRITLLFSGGVDSTRAACKLAETYDRVDLISYTNRYGHYHLRRTAKRAVELQRHYPVSFTHQILSVRDLFEALVIDSIRDDYQRHGSGFIWCMGCKLAMHIQTIVYNLEGGIALVADGSSSATSEMVEQMPASVALVKGFYREYGIAFENPVYESSREESIEYLRNRGFRMGVRLGDRFLGIQPKCRPGELYYMPFLLLGTMPDHQESKVTDFINAKLELGRKWIADALDRREFKPDESDS